MMDSSLQVHKLNRKRRIYSMRGQGVKKAGLEVRYWTPEGKGRTIAWAEDPHPGLDRRFKGNPEWMTLRSWKGTGLVLQLRVNLRTADLSFRVWGHSHREYFILSPEDRAFLASTSSTNSLQKIEPLLSRYLQQKIRERRKYLYSRRYKPGRRT